MKQRRRACACSATGWLLILLLSQLSAGQISAAACANLATVFETFGFTTQLSPFNNTFPECGCNFTITVPTESVASAQCSKTKAHPLYSVDSITISKPPISLQSFPPLLINASGNSEGFEYLHSLSFTNEALQGFALINGEFLPSRTLLIDISNNTNLAPWPGLDSQGHTPYYSFVTVIQEGVRGACCPPPGNADLTVDCMPLAAVCTGANVTATGEVTRVVVGTAVVVTPTGDEGGFRAFTGASWTSEGVVMVPLSSSSGSIFLLAALCLLVGGVLVVGTVMHATYRTQKPIQPMLDDAYDDRRQSRII
ncbi:hypothetical protein BC830DRAFT_1144801 [Chytriomyces sp. MP71]|nr:hypothetical protein BC830DRAFT_1144801 [Chytriomyces sp. MP71]